MLWISLALADPCAAVEGPCSVVERTSTPVGTVTHVKHDADPKAERDFSEPGSCITESWVLEKPGSAPAIVLQVCNDGYGASGVGEDSVTIEGSVFEHQQYGGSAMRWTQATAVDLATRQLVRESSGSMYFLVESKTDWDWRTFSGTASQGYCMASDDQTILEVSHPVIPRVQASGYDPARTGLGACALAVDSAKGPLVHGGAGQSGDASMKVAFVGEQLVVEVTDDAWVPTAKSWIHADHLEIWVSDDLPWNACLEKELGARQWGVLLSGQVERAHGDPPPIQAVVHGSGATRRFVITGLGEPARIAVVYSDSDDGRRQERLIGTSLVQFGKGVSLGTTFRVRPERAICEGTDALSPRQTYAPRGPLLESTP